MRAEWFGEVGDDGDGGVGEGGAGGELGGEGFGETFDELVLEDGSADGDGPDLWVRGLWGSRLRSVAVVGDI